MLTSGLSSEALRMLESMPKLDHFIQPLTIIWLEHDLLAIARRERDGKADYYLT